MIFSLIDMACSGALIACLPTPPPAGARAPMPRAEGQRGHADGAREGGRDRPRQGGPGPQGHRGDRREQGGEAEDPGRGRRGARRPALAPSRSSTAKKATAA